jgi:hypothetical protein
MWGCGIKAKIIKNKVILDNLIKGLTLFFFSFHVECEKENLAQHAAVAYMITASSKFLYELLFSNCTLKG